MEMRQISWETYLLCLFSDFVASEKERVRGRSSDSERELSMENGTRARGESVTVGHWWWVGLIVLNPS